MSQEGKEGKGRKRKNLFDSLSATVKGMLFEEGVVDPSVANVGRKPELTKNVSRSHESDTPPVVPREVSLPNDPDAAQEVYQTIKGHIEKTGQALEKFEEILQSLSASIADERVRFTTALHVAGVAGITPSSILDAIAQQKRSLTELSENSHTSLKQREAEFVAREKALTAKQDELNTLATRITEIQERMKHISEERVRDETAIKEDRKKSGTSAQRFEVVVKRIKSELDAMEERVGQSTRGGG